jgi:lipopolysaccharide/colanic/teichoic acid biosynthesis glycosyltransferase
MSEQVSDVSGISRLTESARANRGEPVEHLNDVLVPVLISPPADADDIPRYVAHVEAQTGYVRFSRSYRVCKRILDLVISSIALLVLLPVFIIVALAIRIDSPGSPLFVQPRVGYRGRTFRVYKFRTMVNGSSVRLNGSTPHKVDYDDRVTQVGKLLRKTSIDELPQLVNVLLGQMSLVGPRPEIVEVVLTKYQPWQYRRLLVPQGITGWWQVTGRGGKILYKHTEDDLHYINHASLLFDTKILLSTIPAVLRRDGAF